ncbi:CD63 antigen [Esox lucius]|uniref:Tetraspanin n=1 Tax=Esox lucius TaxID=8010 RepID=A0AAY5KXB0_ESOLU|nr:CD63 antigen [Esox lucius]
MGVEGGMKCVKYLLFFFNFIFWLCGLAMIVVGVLVQVAINNTIVINNVSASSVPIVIIVVGVIVFFIAFFGCCGAWKESYCMVTMFSILLSLIIIIEIGAAIAGYVFRGKLTDIVHDSLNDMVNRYSNGSKEFQEAVDKLQTDLKCCGMNSSADWRGTFGTGADVPDSCCVTVTNNCGKGAMLNPGKVHITGCEALVEEMLKKNTLWIIIAALVIAFLQIMGIIFACMLMRGIRSGYEVM